MTYYGQWKEYGKGVDQVLHETYFKDKKQGFFIECGAFDGLIENSCKFFEDSMGWTGINVEPVPYIYDQLAINRPKCINLQVALSNHNGTVPFTQASRPDVGNGSIQHTAAHMQELKETNCSFTTFNVKTLTYRDMIDQCSILTPIDLFVLDVEGHEIEVIEGMVGARILPRVMCVEHSSHGIDKLSAILGPMGYKFDFTAWNNAHYVR